MLQVVAGQRLMAGSIRTPDRNDNTPEISFPDDLPFELDVLEAALHISISKLDGELLHTQDLVQTCLHRLPRDITPGNLDELRKAKSALVELESKSEAFRCASNISAEVDLRTWRYTGVRSCTTACPLQSSLVVVAGGGRGVCRSRGSGVSHMHGNGK